MKKVVLLIILIAALFGLSKIPNLNWKYQKLESQQPIAKSQQPFTVALDWVPNTNHTGIYVAQNKGWYKEEGLDVKILPYSQVAVDTLVFENKADVGISSTENILAQSAIDNPVISIAAILPTNTSGIITLEKSGIKSPKDLDGKIYGGFGLAYEEAVIRKVIQADGGTGEFTNIILETAAMDALFSEKIDFVWVFEGWDKIIADEKDISTNFFPITKFSIPDYYTPNIITAQNQINHRENQIKKFLKATKKGYDFAKDNPEESAKILISQTPEGTFPDADLVIKSQIFLSDIMAKSEYPWGYQEKEMWENYPKFMIENKALTDSQGNPVKEIEFEKLYTNDFLTN